MANALKENLKKFDIIYIVAIWNYPVAAAAYYCRKFKLPYIISPRGLLYPYVTAKKAWKKWPYYYLITKRDLNGATAIHYTTEDEAEKCHLPLGLKNRAFIIPNGIDLSEFKGLPVKEKLSQRYPVLRGKKVILFLGRINWKKGLDILVKAFGGLAKEREDLHLLIAGNDEAGYGKKVKRWVAELGLKDCVTFTGMLVGREKLEAYAASDIFAFPSYSENFGMTVIEAMACGIPVVISDKVGISSEIRENKAGIVVDTNVNSLYNGINLLLKNPVLRTELITNGRRLVQEHYDINKVAGETIKAYEEILKK
jgi:glycosyltransferase involved in cell wall biosynthesis